jgi:hypothetical protein
MFSGACLHMFYPVGQSFLFNLFAELIVKSLDQNFEFFRVLNIARIGLNRIVKVSSHANPCHAKCLIGASRYKCTEAMSSFTFIDEAALRARRR